MRAKTVYFRFQIGNTARASLADEFEIQLAWTDWANSLIKYHTQLTAQTSMASTVLSISPSLFLYVSIFFLVCFSLSLHVLIECQCWLQVSVYEDSSRCQRLRKAIRCLINRDIRSYGMEINGKCWIILLDYELLMMILSLNYSTPLCNGTHE